MKRRPMAPRSAAVVGLCLALGLCTQLEAQEAKGSITANGKGGKFQHAYAMEIDSDTEAGYLDVRIVLADRRLTPLEVRNDERLEGMSHKDGLVALVVILDPDARVKSAMPLHPAFTAFISSGAFVSWEPSAYDDVVAGRFHTGGEQEAFNQRWQYDVTFSAPIELDPEAKTVD